MRLPLKRNLRWIIPVVLVLLALAWLDQHYVSPRQVGEDDLTGMTMDQMRSKYGEPNRAEKDFWIYYRGMLGGGTGIQFKDGVVSHYEVRGAR